YGMNWPEYRHDNYPKWRREGGWSISQGQCWAHYSNTPFRKYKQYVHAGGIASPFVVQWPAAIPEGGKIVKDRPFHLIDVLPTMCELAGTEYPSQHDGQPVKSTPGISMVSSWTGDAPEPAPRTLYWQHLNHAAIRDGDWKMVTLDDRDAQRWELYDLRHDRSETDNVASSHPQVVASLKDKGHRWAKAANVVPFPEDRDAPKPNPIGD
ncbi:MAG: sulfatase/phosphatase domain-containing protein, partial [Planctomycetota bacterium]